VAIGVIGCSRRRAERFTAAQLDLVKTFADQARVAASVESMIEADDIGALALKGLARPVPAWSLRGLTP
jgi:class 3 adenylate cyclase